MREGGGGPAAALLPSNFFSTPLPCLRSAHLDALQHPLALPRRDGQVVDEVAVQVRHLGPRQRLQLSDTAHTHNLLAIITAGGGGDQVGQHLTQCCTNPTRSYLRTGGKGGIVKKSVRQSEEETSKTTLP